MCYKPQTVGWTSYLCAKQMRRQQVEDRFLFLFSQLREWLAREAKSSIEDNRKAAEIKKGRADKMLTIT